MTKRIDVRHEDPDLQRAYETYHDQYSRWERRQGTRKGPHHFDWEILNTSWMNYLRLRNKIEGPK